MPGETLSVSLAHGFGAFRLEAAFEAPPGITALFGRSGAGKTTVVNAVAGLLRPERGRIALGDTVLLDTARGLCLPPHRRRIGYVFQDGRLFPHMTVAQNLAYGARFAPRGAAAPARADVVELLGIGHLLARRPAGLSGGEKQRVAIGRALLSAPRLLLMDEPLAALDEARKAEIIPHLERLRDGTGLPILYVSHAIPEVARLATTVVAMAEGRVLRAGPAEAVLSDPQAVPALGVRMAGAVLAGRILAHDDADGLTEIAVSAGRLLLPRIDAAEGAPVRVRIAAHDIVLARTAPEGLSALNVLPATVTEIREGEGPGAAVGLAAGQDLLLARLTRRSVRMLGLAPGLAVHAIVKATSIAPADVAAGRPPADVAAGHLPARRA